MPLLETQVLDFPLADVRHRGNDLKSESWMLARALIVRESRVPLSSRRVWAGCREHPARVYPPDGNPR